MNGNTRYINNADQPTCKHCGLYVSKPEPEGNRIRYVCNRCGPVLEYVSAPVV